MHTYRYSLKTCALFILIAMYTSNIRVWSAREGMYWKISNSNFTSAPIKQVYDGNYYPENNNSKLLATNVAGGELAPLRPSGKSNIFNVINYGAKGDGKTDDSKAFLSAWAAACKGQAPIMLIPSGRTFLVYPISFLGKGCVNNIVVQLEGKIIAPTPGAWPLGVSTWIAFQYTIGMTIQGKGVIDGQGSFWRTSSLIEVSAENNSMDNTHRLNQPNVKPTAVWIFKSRNVKVSGITIQNSPQFNLMFLDSTTINVFGVRISSPGDSHNTDGIHLQHATNVNISQTNIACGDDCISIQTGCSNIHINNVNCGPGHGISIGGLNMEARVSDVEVRDSIIHDALYGVRIKTWQGGSGSVQGVTYSNVHVSAVAYPILINQYYCGKAAQCANQTSAVAISGINYIGIRGTYTEEPVHLACSESVPCTKLTLAGIELKPVKRVAAPFCWKAYGEVKTPTIPPINCLQNARQNQKSYQ